MKNKLTHNCPNCGAVLRQDGFCEYCKTKIRYANVVELNLDIFKNDIVEILITKRNRDKSITLIPVKGRIRALNVTSGEDATLYADDVVVHTFVCQPPTVEIYFEGHVDNYDAQEAI